jgi:hypothetical protein
VVTQIEAGLVKISRSIRELFSKSGKLSAEGRAICTNAAKLHSESRKLWLEGMIEWEKASRR